MRHIPDHYHFVFGLRPQTEPFHIAWYLCLRSCIEVNRPARVTLHYHHEPHGEWWERIRPELELVRVEPEAFVVASDAYQRHDEGRFIQRVGLDYAHQADFIRLRALREHGGVYADIDTLFVRPYPEVFFDQPCVMGRETDANEEETLCNALIMAEPGSVFVATWLERMYAVFDGSWNRHSCIEPARLSHELPEAIRVVPREYFFHFPYTTAGLAALFGKVTEMPDEVCSIHMWSHLWWEPWRTDFVRFHNGMLTERFIREVDTTYNLIARRYLD